MTMKPCLMIPIVLIALLGNLPAQASDKESMASFDAYLTSCPKNEIRCIWFLNSVRVGMVMKIDLLANEVLTVREVHDWAHQNSETRTLSHCQIETLKGLIAEPPESVAGDRLGSVFISFWRDGKVEQREYERARLPGFVQRIYDIGGGYIDTTIQGEQVRADQPVTAPESK